MGGPIKVTLRELYPSPALLLVILSHSWADLFKPVTSSCFALCLRANLRNREVLGLPLTVERLSAADFATLRGRG